MCKASEIHCHDASCCRPIGWYVTQPCTPFRKANGGMPPAFDGGHDLNWNTSTGGCGVPRLVSTKKSTCRRCQPCIWKAICSNFAWMKDWAHVAGTHWKYLAEAPGDCLLLRRTKTRLRREYLQSQSQGKKRKRTDEGAELPTPPLSRQASQPETTPDPSTRPRMPAHLGHYPTPPKESRDAETVDPLDTIVHSTVPTTQPPNGQD